MDDVDKGNHQAELALQAYIDRVRRQVSHVERVTHFCLNCEEECRGRLFCSTECRDDYEKRALLATKLNKEK